MHCGIELKKAGYIDTKRPNGIVTLAERLNELVQHGTKVK